ncbi:MAG TPA: NAD(P)/FAD-dependent oxidoreductase [Casimicrobiaceae bacterium]|nr:NAD(P)/FAD-dependent oxidoreductase [Casimicrobiaceae bacterium]
MPTSRRDVLAAGAGWLAGAALGAGPGPARTASARVVVVGGGYGGATAAKYVRKLSRGAIGVALVEREEAFVSCPLSNLVIGGSREIADITVAYDGLDRWGVRRVRDEAIAIDPIARKVRLAGGETLAYDRLVLSPGIDFIWESVPSLADADARRKVLHAWQGGLQTTALRRQLEAMRDGGVFVIHVPTMPYRCAPAPYERACQVAFYFSTRKPRSKVIVLDANAELQSKKEIFTAAWNERYKGIVDYRPDSELADVDASTLTAKLVFDDVKADVLNVIPPQRAGAIARQLGMANSNARFCQVDFLTYESTVQPGVHLIGDAIQTAPLMAKAGQMANRQARICAAAVVAQLSGEEVNASPSIESLCYSFVDDRRAAHVASVHRYDQVAKTMLPVAGRTEVSVAASVEEGADAQAWARNIWADMLS